MTSRRPLVVIGGRIQELPIGDDVAAVVNDPEFVRDVIAAALVAGTNINITVNDGADTITIATTVDAEYIRDTMGTALQASTGLSIVVNDVANTITYSVDVEYLIDLLASSLSGSNGVTVTYDDPGNTILISGDPEYIRDTIGATLVAGTGVTITVDDAANTITITADGSDLIPFIYAPAVYYPGTMKTSAITMMRHTFVEECSLPANCAGSQGGGEVNATTTTVYKVQRSLAATPDAYTDIASISYAAGTHVPTFSTSAGVDYTFAIGDTMRVVGPDVPDTTLSDTNFTLLLMRIT
jgi:hypothetical protein